MPGRKTKRGTARYAILPAILAGLGCLAASVLLAVLAADRLGVGSIPDEAGIRRALYISLALVVVGAAAYVLMVPDRARRYVGGRQARYGSNAAVMSLAFAGIIVVSNMLAYRFPQEQDVTEDKSNTLAPETLQALAMVPEKVTALAFYTSPSDFAEDLLSALKSNSAGKFDYQYVNPDLDPVAARRAGITGEGNIALLMGDRTEIANFASETEVTRALIRLISPEPRAVYFLTGHGEADLNSSDETGLSKAKEMLESKNYTVSELRLLTSDEVPSDALAIIVAGPQKPVGSQEISILREYIANGGSLVVMEDPLQFTEFGSAPDPLATYLSTTWGVTLEDDVILNPASTNPLLAVSETGNQHAVTRNIRYAIIMPGARSLGLRPKDGVTQTDLILTSSQAWGETDFGDEAEGTNPSFSESEDHAGPLSMAVAAENPESRARVVVFGNSAFATDDALDAYGNANLFVNAVDWAAEQEDLLDITPRTPIERTFTPPGPLQQIAILLGSVLGLPGLFAAAGIYAWAARRRRG